MVILLSELPSQLAFAFPLDRLRTLLGAGAALIVVVTACALLFAEDRRRGGVWSRKWIGTATPEALAAIRIVVLGIVFAVVAWEDLPSSASIPRSLLELRGKGVMSLVAHVPGYQAFVASYPALLALKLLLLGLLALGMVGFRARVVLPLCFAGYLLYGGILRHYAHFFHQGLLPLYALFVLIFTPCADAWSLDRRLREKRGLPVPPKDVPAAVYGFGRWAVFALMGLCYFSAGLSKLRQGGFHWWEADNMRSKILIGALEPKLELPFAMTIAWQPDWTLAALGLFTLVVEGGMIFVLVSARSRVVLAPAIALLHIGVLFAQEILFFDLIVLPLIFLHPHHLARAGAALFRSRREALFHFRAGLVESGFARAADPQSHEQPQAAPEGAKRAASPPGPAGGGGGTRASEEGESEGAKRAASAPRSRSAVYLAVAYLVVLVFTIEWYPLTAWQMFAKRFATTEIDYLKVRERRADGSIVKTRIEQDIGALLDARYRETMWPYFEKGDALSRKRLDELLQKVIELRNARVPQDQRIVGFVIEHRLWDWRAAPDDPDYGRRLGVYTYPAEPPPDG
jgi:hypothetical protein